MLSSVAFSWTGGDGGRLFYTLPAPSGNETHAIMKERPPLTSPAVRTAIERRESHGNASLFLRWTGWGAMLSCVRINAREWSSLSIYFYFCFGRESSWS